MGVNDRLGIIFRERRFIEKHNLMKIVKDKADHMLEEVQQFQKKLQAIFDKGLPSFWDNNGQLLIKDDYDNLIYKERMNHNKFEDKENNLKGENIVSKISDDFDVLCQLQEFIFNLPSISYA